MATKTPETFRAKDGKLFGTYEEAVRHEKLIDAKEKYEHARNLYARELWQSQKTADGQMFQISGLSDYYYITPGHYSMPEIRVVSFYVWTMELDSDDDAVTILYKQDLDKEWRRYKINELYKSKRAAQIELMKRLEIWLKEKAEQIEDFRKENFPQRQSP